MNIFSNSKLKDLYRFLNRLLPGFFLTTIIIQISCSNHEQDPESTKANLSLENFSAERNFFFQEYNDHHTHLFLNPINNNDTMCTSEASNLERVIEYASKRALHKSQKELFLKNIIEFYCSSAKNMQVFLDFLEHPSPSFCDVFLFDFIKEICKSSNILSYSQPLQNCNHIFFGFSESLDMYKFESNGKFDFLEISMDFHFFARLGKMRDGNNFEKFCVEFFKRLFGLKCVTKISIVCNERFEYELITNVSFFEKLRPHRFELQYEYSKFDVLSKFDTRGIEEMKVIVTNAHHQTIKPPRLESLTVLHIKTRSFFTTIELNLSSVNSTLLHLFLDGIIIDVQLISILIEYTSLITINFVNCKFEVESFNVLGFSVQILDKIGIFKSNITEEHTPLCCISSHQLTNSTSLRSLSFVMDDERSQIYVERFLAIDSLKDVITELEISTETLPTNLIRILFGLNRLERLQIYSNDEYIKLPSEIACGETLKNLLWIDYPENGNGILDMTFLRSCKSLEKLEIRTNRTLKMELPGIRCKKDFSVHHFHSFLTSSSLRELKIHVLMFSQFDVYVEILKNKCIQESLTKLSVCTEDLPICDKIFNSIYSLRNLRSLSLSSEPTQLDRIIQMLNEIKEHSKITSLDIRTGLITRELVFALNDLKELKILHLTTDINTFCNAIASEQILEQVEYLHIINRGTVESLHSMIERVAFLFQNLKMLRCSNHLFFNEISKEKISELREKLKYVKYPIIVGIVKLFSVN